MDKHSERGVYCMALYPVGYIHRLHGDSKRRPNSMARYPERDNDCDGRRAEFYRDGMAADSSSVHNRLHGDSIDRPGGMAGYPIGYICCDERYPAFDNDCLADNPELHFNGVPGNHGCDSDCLAYHPDNYYYRYDGCDDGGSDCLAYYSNGVLNGVQRDIHGN